MSKKISILLVESNGNSAAEMKKCFNPENVEITVTRSFEECVKLVKRRKYDAVFMGASDIAKSEDATCKIRVMEEKKDYRLPIVAVYDACAGIRAGIMSGIDRCLRYPICNYDVAVTLKSLNLTT